MFTAGENLLSHQTGLCARGTCRVLRLPVLPKATRQSKDGSARMGWECSRLRLSRHCPQGSVWRGRKAITVINVITVLESLSLKQFYKKKETFSF